MEKTDEGEKKATFRCSKCGSYAVEVEGLIEALQEQRKILDEILEIVQDLWQHGLGKFQI